MAGIIKQKLYNSPQPVVPTTAAPQLPVTLDKPGVMGPQPAVPAPAAPQLKPGKANTASIDILSQLPDIIKQAQAATPAMQAPATVKAVTPGATTGTVDQGQTTAGLIEKMLAQDSDYINRAKAIAMERMGERGLQSSSLAQGAGVGAAIDAAGNVAAQDANIYSQQRLANQNALNEMASQNANREMTAGTFNAGATNDQTAAQYDASNQLSRSIIGSQLSRGEMEFGAGLDMQKMAVANGFDLQKMAAQQGYSIEQMAAALGFDMQKMAAGQELDLQKLAAANDYDLGKMKVDFEQRVKLQEAAARLDGEARKDLMTFEAQLGNSATGKSALANLASKYADLFDITRRDPSLTAEDKVSALADLRADFKSNAAVVANLYTLDASEYLAAIGVPAPAPTPQLPTTLPPGDKSPSEGYMSPGAP